MNGIDNQPRRVRVGLCLAGRVALLPLLPFSLRELETAGLVASRLEEHLFTGAYPPIHDRKLEPGLWYGNYVSTYLERIAPATRWMC